eukprot:scaffold10576_cov115-Isochrysis_galbana.AAC.7
MAVCFTKKLVVLSCSSHSRVFTPPRPVEGPEELNFARVGGGRPDLAEGRGGVAADGGVGSKGKYTGGGCGAGGGASKLGGYIGAKGMRGGCTGMTIGWSAGVLSGL